MADDATHGGSETERQHRPSAFTVLVTVAMLLIVVLALSAFLPRWWAHRVGDQANESFASGIGLGLFYGLVFTALPLLVLWTGIRRSHGWRPALVVFGVGALLATPNLLTLSIAVGVGRGAHAGERTLDVQAPGFRWSSLVGAVVAVVVLAALAALFRSRRRAKAEAAALRAELDAQVVLHAKERDAARYDREPIEQPPEQPVQPDTPEPDS